MAGSSLIQQCWFRASQEDLQALKRFAASIGVLPSVAARRLVRAGIEAAEAKPVS